MYIARVEESGVLHGWFQDGPVDIFVWFEHSALVQVQITVGSEVAEWSTPARLATGVLRETAPPGRLRGQGAAVIDFDRRPRQERLAAIRAAVAGSALPAPVVGLVDALLKRQPPGEECATVEIIVRAAPVVAETPGA